MVRKLKYLSLLSLFLLGACSISRPISGPGYDARTKLFRTKNTNTVFVSITNAKLIGSKRISFDRYTQELYLTLDGRRGYLGGSIRKEIFGNEVWTFTVWENHEAMKEFVYSRDHLNAIYMSSEAIEVMRSINFDHPSSTQLNWERIYQEISKVEFKSLKKM